MPSGAEAIVAFKVQSAINTVASGTYAPVYADDFSYDSGRVYNYGRVRIGSSLSNHAAGIVLAAKPYMTISKPLDLVTDGVFLEMGGRTNSTGTYTETVAAASTKYTTGLVQPITGKKVQIIDMKASRVTISHPAADEATLEASMIGGAMADSSVTVGTISATLLQPSPAETISGANSTFAGGTGTITLSLQYSILQNLNNNRQPLGTLHPDDIRSISNQTMAVVALDYTATYWNTFGWGASGSTATSTTSATGTLHYRLSTPGGATFIDYSWAGGEYALDQTARIRAAEDQMLLVRARPTGAVTETIDNTV